MKVFDRTAAGVPAKHAADRRNFQVGFCAGLALSLICAVLLLLARIFG